MGTSTARHAEVLVADLAPADYDAAVGVLARGMRDNPIHVAAYGPDPDRRERCQARLVRALFHASRGNEPLGVWRDGVLVACTGVLLDGACRPGLAEQLRLLPAMTRLGPRTLGRVAAWLGVWAEHEPKEAHAHLGPLAVDRDLQSQGLGSILLAEHTRRLDQAGLLGYLETDKPENVRFYTRAGYRVVAEAPALGVPSWFMRREPRARARA